MKTVTICNAVDYASVVGSGKYCITVAGEEDLKVSDGYHTIDELYEHRIEIFIALCRALQEHSDVVWRSQYHSDGSKFDEWFILGINKEKGKQITYHLPITKWYATEFAETMDFAPEFDGHTPQDVLERLKYL